MKKIMILGIIFMVGLVSALAIGTILTQGQVDALDFDSLNLGNGFVKVDNTPKYSCNILGECYFYVSINGLDKIEEGYRYVIREEIIIIDKIDWINLKKETNTTHMLSELRTHLIGDYNRIVSERAIELKKYQTPEEDFDNLIVGLDLP